MTCPTSVGANGFEFDEECSKSERTSSTLRMHPREEAGILRGMSCAPFIATLGTLLVMTGAPVERAMSTQQTRASGPNPNFSLASETDRETDALTVLSV